MKTASGNAELSSEIWFENPYFEEVSHSLDGGSTSHGPLWHSVSPRWGHSMHSMCSYHGSFPPRLAHYFIQRFTNPGMVVLDPFSGRGTSILQSRVEGRPSLGTDLNPLAYVLTKAKSAPPTYEGFLRYVEALEKGYSGLVVNVDVESDIRMLFHKRTLDQLLFLRSILLSRPWSRWSKNDFFLAGVVAGILHGATRSDGSSGYLSISMPNTFSMSPSYVKRYIKANHLKPPKQNVFDVVREKAARLFLDSAVGVNGKAFYTDAASLMLATKTIPSNSVDLVLTSPPYLQVMNYGQSNWIRLWWLGFEQVARGTGQGRRSLDDDLDHAHTMDSYVAFMAKVFRGISRVLKKNGVAVIVIGDVAEPGRDVRHVAEVLWDQIGQETDLTRMDTIEDRLNVGSKVSRIWKETRGQATNIDRIMLLTKRTGSPVVDNPEVDWTEPYKDSGPDAAHKAVR